MAHPLKAYRLKTGTSLDKLAGRIGVSKATLSRIENGKQTPSLDLVHRLRTATEGVVTANDFLPSAAHPSEAAA